MLFAAKSVGLIGGEDQRLSAIRPFESALAFLVDGSLGGRATGEDARFASDHDVTGVVGGSTDQVDEAVSLRPNPDCFGPCPSLPEASTRLDYPAEEVSGWEHLLRTGLQAPAVPGYLIQVPQAVALLLRQVA